MDINIMAELNKSEMRIYLATLGGLLKMINDMDKPSVKKIRGILSEELNKVKNSARIEEVH